MRTLYVSALALLMMTAVAAVGQDLAAIARQQRQQKKPVTKVYTNDDFASGRREEQGLPPAADAKGAADAKAEAKSDAKPAETSSEDKAKETTALQKKVDAQKSEIEMLSRELDIADREFKLQVANYYADAGNSLRDPAAWAKQRDAKEKEINDKKAAVEAAKTKLADLLEQGRKAGLNVKE